MIQSLTILSYLRSQTNVWILPQRVGQWRWVNLHHVLSDNAFLDQPGVLPKLPETFEEAVVFVERIRILDFTGFPKTIDSGDESDASFIDVEDVNKDDDAGGTIINDDEASPTDSPIAPTGLQPALGYSHDRGAYLDFRVITFFPTLTNRI